jgi:hypothetical protein
MTLSCFPANHLGPAHPTDASALVAALTRFSHLAADTIVNGGATSHLAPTNLADRKWVQLPQCSVGWGKEALGRGSAHTPLPLQA